MGHGSFNSFNVHIWLVALDVKDGVFDILLHHLSSDENQRADQFSFTQDRRNFITSRGILRDILSGYLRCQPADIRFRYSPVGKPALDLSGTSASLEFNISHSSGILVVAVTQGEKVGVDIELIRLMPDMNLVASHSFSKYEQNALSLLPVDERNLAFFRCWTRKEAYLKAAGYGMSMPLDSFDVSLAPDNPIGMLSNRVHPTEISRWSFYTFIPLPGFIGAVVIEDQVVTPSFRQWEPESK